MAPAQHGTSPRWVAVRWALLAGVVLGLFGMHVLTADHQAGGHGALPVMSSASHTMTGQDMTGQDSATSATPIPADGAEFGAAATVSPADGFDWSHGAMAGCLLFLMVTGAFAALALLQGRRPTGADGSTWPLGAALMEMLGRGPPGPPCRLALCVNRI